MAGSSANVTASLLKSFAAGKKGEKPYPHWFVENCLPADVVDQCLGLPFPTPGLDGISGKRELHNATRRYFDAENRAKYSFVEDITRGARQNSNKPGLTSIPLARTNTPILDPPRPGEG